MTEKTKFVDTDGFKNLIYHRMNTIAKSPAKIDMYDPTAALSKKLHPEILHLIIDSIKEETKTAKTYQLKSLEKNSPLPIFHPGQYLSLKSSVHETAITRPYSISSSPQDAVNKGFYEITIKKKEKGFFTHYIWDNWKIGTPVEATAPHGHLFYKEIRDTKNLVGICGGCGITPFRSIIKDMIEKDSDLTLTLFYGLTDPEDIIFKEELTTYKNMSQGKINIIYVCSNEIENWKGRTGLITADLIKKQIDIQNKTFYICGPTNMYQFLDKEIEKLDIPPKRIRKEVSGQINDICKYEQFPKEFKNKTFYIKVKIGRSYQTILGNAADPLLTTLEKMKFNPPSVCRSGECGFCRARLISGNIFIKPDGDKRRMGDIKYGYIHPCAAYPLSNIEIELPLADNIKT